jgi:hypothetical protein
MDNAACKDSVVNDLYDRIFCVINTNIAKSKKMNVRMQLTVFGILLLVNVFLAFATYLWMPFEQLGMGAELPAQLSAMPRWQLALMNAGYVLVLYGLLGLAGFWFARRLGLPGIFREGAGWRAWVLTPMLIGAAVGVLMVAFDRLFALWHSWNGFPHPPFPLSLVASGSAGIGEEIVFRLFLMGLWAFLLILLLGRWVPMGVSLWAANLIAALAFSAGHLPLAMTLFKVSSPAQLPLVVLAEVFLLNGGLGLVAGEQFVRDGFLAAVGVHFWADVVWHVIFPLLGL